jgi:hypothetical protein
MLEWERFLSKSPRRGEMIHWIARTSAREWNLIDEAIAEFWNKLWDCLQSDAVASEPWDVLLIMVRPDSGRISGYPTQLPARKGIARVMVSLVLEVVDEIYHDHSDDSDEDFEIWHDDVMDKIFGSLKRTMDAQVSSASMASAMERNKFKIYGVHYDDMETAFPMRT